jgi:hypothetical protein
MENSEILVTIGTDGNISVSMKGRVAPPMLFGVAALLERFANQMLDASDMQRAQAQNQIAMLGDLKRKQ